ncbi:MAG: cupin domain-containing protein [Proteobacteria bacterium]|nr:cupin domain-containing protein [Pseudomonadota bacterium]
MKVMKYTEAAPVEFDNDVARGVTGRVIIGQADGADNFCMRVFEIKKDGHTPRHSHDWEHEIFFHSGNGEVLLNGDWLPVTDGTAAFIPGNEEHQIRNTGDSLLVFACLIPSGAPEM